MQFIDQSAAYSVKSISLSKAISSGRAHLSVSPGGAKAVTCFCPGLHAATEFDREINEKLKFNALPTAEKLDLMIAELLPRFFRAEKVEQSGRKSWLALFLIDGRIERRLLVNQDGVSVVSATERKPDFELETDITTLMAILRSIIADFHTNKLDLEAL